MSGPREDEVRIATEAARWQRALENGDERVAAEFADWAKASPRHLREFLFMEALASAAKTIDPEKKIEIDLDFARRRDNVAALGHDPESARASRSRKRRWAVPVALAAGTAAVAIGLIASLAPAVIGGWQRYSTAVGEQRDVTLDDGSVVQLNVRSKLKVRFSDGARELQLVEGEALFKVAPERERPFEVRAGDAVIRAVGTAFNVHRTSVRTTVAVLEGKVRIQSGAPSTGASVDARAAEFFGSGETARVEHHGAVVREARTPVTEAVAWRQRRLVFREETLATIADEFNRYNTLPRITIQGDTARARRFGGTFDANDTASLVKFVIRSGELTAEVRDDEIVIRPK